MTVGASMYDVVATEPGPRFHAHANLAALPDGRANQWGGLVDGAVARLREMEARLTSERGPQCDY